MNKHFYDNFLLVSQCDKARPYLMRLYIIFPIHLSFPIRSRCVLKATVSFIEKNSGLFYSYLSKCFLFQKDTFCESYMHVVYDEFFYFITICSYFSCFFIYHLSVTFATSCSIHAVLSQYF